MISFFSVALTFSIIINALSVNGCDLVSIADAGNNEACPPGIQDEMAELLTGISTCVLKQNTRNRGLRSLQPWCCSCRWCQPLSQPWWCFYPPCNGGRRNLEVDSTGETEQEPEVEAVLAGKKKLVEADSTDETEQEQEVLADLLAGKKKLVEVVSTRETEQEEEAEAVLAGKKKLVDVAWTDETEQEEEVPADLLLAGKKKLVEVAWTDGTEQEEEVPADLLLLAGKKKLVEVASTGETQAVRRDLASTREENVAPVDFPWAEYGATILDNTACIPPDVKPHLKKCLATVVTIASETCGI